MNELNEIPKQQGDPADALAGLADGGDGEIIVPDKQDEVNPLLALDEMARTAAGAPDFTAAAETVAADVSDEVFSGGVSLSGAVGRKHVTAGAGYRRHHAHLYKKTMIPLMLLVGATLILIGFLAAIMLFRSDTTDALYYSRMQIVSYVSFPLAAVVLIGAWLFHRDVKK